MIAYSDFGTANIIQLIGVCKNYKYAIEEKIESQRDAVDGNTAEETGRDNGNVYYVNEKARYGDRPALSKGCILTYMATIFFINDPRGYRAGQADLHVLRKMTGLTLKTIRRAIKSLAENGYLAIGNWVSKHIFTFIVCGQEKIYLPASQGGRGYFQMSMENFCEMAQNLTLNEIRVYLRSLIELNKYPSEGEPHPFDRTHLKKSIPDYITNPALDRILDGINRKTGLVRFSHDETGSRLTYGPAGSVKQTILNENVKNKGLLSEFLPKLEKDCRMKMKEAKEFLNKFHAYPSFYTPTEQEKKRAVIDERLTVKDKDETVWEYARIATMHGLDLVKKGLRHIYEECNLRHAQIQNSSAYLRTIISRHPDGDFVPFFA